jgi:hypothetical protein
MNISCRDDEGQSSGLMFIRHSHCLCEYILDPVLHLRPVFSTAFLSDMRDFERAGNPVLLNRLLLRRHDIDRTQHATRQEIYAHSPRLRRHLRLSRHRHHNRHHRKTRVSVSLLSVLRVPEELDCPFGYQMSLRDCGYRCGCICHAFENRGPQSTISDVTMIYVGYPYGWVRCVGKRHQTSVYTVELHAGEDSIKIVGDDREQLTPEGLWTIGTCVVDA